MRKAKRGLSLAAPDTGPSQGLSLIPGPASYRSSSGNRKCERVLPSPGAIDLGWFSFGVFLLQEDLVQTSVVSVKALLCGEYLGFHKEEDKT